MSWGILARGAPVLFSKWGGLQLGIAEFSQGFLDGSPWVNFFCVPHLMRQCKFYAACRIFIQIAEILEGHALEYTLQR